MDRLKSLIARLPSSLQQVVRQAHFRRAIRTGQFSADEPEYQLLPTLVSPGDWVLDIGANVGHYTLELARLVGPQGRVIAFEPVPETFSVLAANVECRGRTANGAPPVQ